MKRLLSLALIGIITLSLVLGGCSASTTKVRVATDATWAPFESVNEQTKQIEGLILTF